MNPTDTNELCFPSTIAGFSKGLLANPKSSCCGRSGWPVLGVTLVSLTWLVYLLIGLYVSADFGTYGDEANCEAFGARWGECIETSLVNRSIPNVEDGVNVSPDLTHGPFWELALFAARKVFLPQEANARAILLLRHRLNFALYFAAGLAVFGVAFKIVRDWRLAFGTWALFVAQPQIFAHAFYNSVDIAFLSFYAIGFYTLWRFRETKSLRWAIGHAFVCAALVDVRIAGLLLAGLTVFVGLQDSWKERRSWQPWTDTLATFGIFSGVCAASIIAFDPFLWRNTIAHFTAMLRGGAFSVEHVDPAYNPILMIATTPAVYTALFLAGLCGMVSARWSGWQEDDPIYRGFELALFLFLTPLVAPIIVGSTLFGGWRHHYFVYVPFVIIAGIGIRVVYGWCDRRVTRNGRFAARLATSVILLGTGGSVVRFMVENHPYEFAYSNGLLGGHSQVLNLDFTSDLWGVSFRQQLEFLATHDHRARMSVYFNPTGGRYNLDILRPEVRQRFRLVETPDRADYLVLKASQIKSHLIYGCVAHMTYVDGVPISGVVKNTLRGSGGAGER